MTNWTEETIKEHLFSEVEILSGENWFKCKLVGHVTDSAGPSYIDIGEYLSKGIRSKSTIIWGSDMRLIPEKKWVDWTPETAPFPLALRYKNWPKGVYKLFSPSLGGVNSCVIWSLENDGFSHCYIPYSDLNSDDSEWETWDGKRCGTEVTEDE